MQSVYIEPPTGGRYSWRYNFTLDVTSMRRSDREKSGRSSFQILRIVMSSTKPLDVVILRKVIVRGEEVPGEPYQEYGGKTKAPKNDWSCYIRSKESEVSIISATLPPWAHAFPPSCSQFDARILRGNASRFGSPLTPATSNSIISVPGARRETR